MKAAVASEDALLYGEPPEWSIPARQDLGRILLKAGKPADAEQAFREDLGRFRDNAWSLYGLAEALDRQGKKAAAAEQRQAFERVWSTADVTMPPA